MNLPSVSLRALGVCTLIVENKMNDLQTFMDGFFAQLKRERSETQMTLGKMIDVLKTMPKDTQVANLISPHSYRGYYEDIAFEKRQGTRSAGELLSDCEKSVGRVFVGYKGGDYRMEETTPAWVAEYGCCGEKILSIGQDGYLETKQDD